MINRKMQIYAERRNFGREVAIYASVQRDDGCLVMLAPGEEKVLTDDSQLGGAFVQMRPEQAQQLMDSLWAAGFRPVDGHGSTGQLAATQMHLQDMRALVAHALKAKLP